MTEVSHCIKMNLCFHMSSSTQKHTFAESNNTYRELQRYIWRVSEPAKNSTEICPISDFSFDTITFASFV